MRKQSIYLILLLLFTFQIATAQQCPMEVGYRYTIYIFSEKNDFTFQELTGKDINPMLVNIIQVKNEATKKKIDNKCLTDRMETSIFIYPTKDKTKTLRFCNQQEYSNALKSNIRLKIYGE